MWQRTPIRAPEGPWSSGRHSPDHVPWRPPLWLIGAGDVVLADRLVVGRVLRLFAGVVGAGRAVRSECRTGRRARLARRGPGLLAALVGLAGSARVAGAGPTRPDGQRQGAEKHTDEQHDLPR